MDLPLLLLKTLILSIRQFVSRHYIFNQIVSSCLNKTAMIVWQMGIVIFLLAVFFCLPLCLYSELLCRLLGYSARCLSDSLIPLAFCFNRKFLVI